MLLKVTAPTHSSKIMQIKVMGRAWWGSKLSEMERGRARKRPERIFRTFLVVQWLDSVLLMQGPRSDA